MTPDQMLSEDMGRFYDDPLGFVRYIYPWESPELIMFKGPDDWQRETLLQIGEEVKKRNFNGFDPVMPLMEAIASGHGIGKSALTAWIVHWIMSTRPFSRGTVTANTASQLESKTWSQISHWVGISLNSHWWKITRGKGSMRMCHVLHLDSWRCDGQTCREQNSEAFAGQHAANSTSFYIFDEASAVPDKIWEVAEGGLTDGEPMWFVFGNPTRNTGRFRECWGKFRRRWIQRQIDSRDCKLPNKQQIAEWEKDYGEDSDFFRVRVKGQFPRSSSTQLISTELVETAQKRVILPNEFRMAPKILGIDPARFGDDLAVIARRQGLASWPPAEYPEIDNMDLVGFAIQHADNWKPDAMFCDAGQGSGVIDRMRQLQYKVIEVDFGGLATLRKDAANKRAEMWLELRDWLKAGGALPDHERLRDDLISVEYGFDRHNRILLEKKESMKARGLDSPDYGDALAVTFAFPVHRSQDIFERQLHKHGQDRFRFQDYDPFADI